MQSTTRLPSRLATSLTRARSPESHAKLGLTHPSILLQTYYELARAPRRTDRTRNEQKRTLVKVGMVQLALIWYITAPV
jgi:hypothetical protein